MKLVRGKVISDKMKKTVVVEVTRFLTHPIYQKRMRRTHNYHADNELGAKLGDEVELKEVKPVSKTKNWQVIKIVKPYAAA